MSKKSRSVKNMAQNMGYDTGIICMLVYIFSLTSYKKTKTAFLKY